MNLKHYIAITLSLLLTLQSLGQISDYNWSKPKEKGDNIISKIIPLRNLNAVIFKPIEKNIRIDFKKKGEQNLTSKNYSFKGKYLGTFEVGADLVIFSLVYSPEEKKDQIIAQSVLENKAEKVILTQSLTSNLHSNFIIDKSPNSNKIVVLTEIPYRKGSKETIVFTVLDQNLKIERTKRYLIGAIPSQKRKINVPIINDNGDVFILKRYRAERGLSHYYLLTYSKTGNTSLNEFKLNYKSIHDAQFVLNEDGELIVGGTYTSPNSNRVEGTYIAKFNSSGDKIFKKEYGISNETLLAFTSEKSMRKYGTGIFYFKTSKIIQQKENISIILEHLQNEANKKTGNNTIISDGLIVTSFDLKGGLLWDKALRTNQNDKTEKGYWNSYISFNDTTNNNIAIIYNEVGYTDKKLDNDFGLNTAVGARQFTIDNQGNLSKTIVKNSFIGTKEQLIFSPKKALQFDNQLYLLAEPIDKSIYLLGTAK